MAGGISFEILQVNGLMVEGSYSDVKSVVVMGEDGKQTVPVRALVVWENVGTHQETKLTAFIPAGKAAEEALITLI